MLGQAGNNHSCFLIGIMENDGYSTPEQTPIQAPPNALPPPLILPPPQILQFHAGIAQNPFPAFVLPANFRLRDGLRSIPNA